MEVLEKLLKVLTALTDLASKKPQRKATTL
jgi:hypothetical protein